MPPVAAGQTSTNDVWMPPPRHPDEQISIGRRRHPDERIFGYPLQALLILENLLSDEIISSESKISRFLLRCPKRATSKN